MVVYYGLLDPAALIADEYKNGDYGHDQPDSGCGTHLSSPFSLEKKKPTSISQTPQKTPIPTVGLATIEPAKSAIPVA